jgi:hypothetical protein
VEKSCILPFVFIRIGFGAVIIKIKLRSNRGERQVAQINGGGELVGTNENPTLENIAGRG